MSAASAAPASPDPYANYRELTLRGMVLGALITVVFTASNVYLGLKVGLTFASSIPAAVISMALLRFARGSNILENNMVQTQASAAGTLSSVIFILPGLLMAGYWSGFPFWQTVLLCTSGGILGVIFTIPLRHAMVVNSPLPYPEGVAAAEILKAGSHEHAEDGSADSGIREIALGGAISGLVSFCANGLRVMADSASYWFKSGTAIFQLPMGYSLALLGAGFLVNLAGGIAILLGIAIAWGVLVPYFSSVAPQPADMDMASYALSLWKNKVRFIGAGTIGVAAIWTLITLLKPMMEGMRLSFKAMSGKHEQGRNRIDQDLGPRAMIAWSVGMLLMLGLGFHHFVDAASIPDGLGWLLVIGESSNLFADEANRQFMVALTLFSGTAVIAVASVSNDNLQDLKTGWLVHATPWRQQVALIIGCVVGALVIAPVLEMLYQAYGFTGAMPREGMDASQALAAPQATLMTTIANGIFRHDLQWSYIFTGMGIGVALIIVDVLLRRKEGSNLSLPVLAVGMGIYLPPSINTPIVLGTLLAAWLRWRIRSRHGNNAAGPLKRAERTGTLFAAGLIVGESLVGVLLAFIIAFSVTSGGSEAPLALNLENWDTAAAWLGLAAFVGSALVLGRRVLTAAR